MDLLAIPHCVPLSSSSLMSPHVVNIIFCISPLRPFYPSLFVPRFSKTTFLLFSLTISATFVFVNCVFLFVFYNARLKKRNILLTFWSSFSLFIKIHFLFSLPHSFVRVIWHLWHIFICNCYLFAKNLLTTPFLYFQYPFPHFRIIHFSSTVFPMFRFISSSRHLLSE